MKITLQSKLGKICNNRGRTKEKYDFFNLAVLMHNSRQRKGKPREYCSGANLRIIYKMLEEQRPGLLLFNGVKLSYEEYEKIIVEYLEGVKATIINGKPAILPGNIGAIGIEIYNYKRQTASSRLKKDKDKVYFDFPSYRIFHQKRHLYKSVSPLVNIDEHRIDSTTKEYHTIINNHMKSKAYYALTGDNMHTYARKIDYNGTSK